MDQHSIVALESVVKRDYGNIAGIVVRKSGEKVYEGYFGGHSAGQAVHVYSVTKSVFSLLIGIAIDKGLIRSVEQKVSAFFPDCAVKSITLKNLLTMTAPYKCETEPYEAFFESGHWMAKTACTRRWAMAAM